MIQQNLLKLIDLHIYNKTNDLLQILILVISNVNSIFQNPIIRRRIIRVSVRNRISPGQPETARAAHHRQLTVGAPDRIPPHNTDRAPTILPRREVEIQVHSEGRLVQAREGYHPLGPAQFLGVPVGLCGDQVVQDPDLAEGGGGSGCDVGPGHLRDGGVGPAESVLEEEVELEDLFLGL